MLGKRGDYQRAEEYYAKVCALLNEEGKAPDRRTLKTMNALRSGQHPSLLGTENEPSVPLSPVIPQSIIEVVNQSEEVTHQPGAQDMELSRRIFLQNLGILGAELCITPQFQDNSSSAKNQLLTVSQASVTNLAAITLQFRAMQRRGDVFITNGVKSHIQTIQEALEQTTHDTIRSDLWKVLAQTQTVAGFNPIKKTGRGQKKTFLEAAVASAKNSGDVLLIGASLGHLAHFSLREEQNLMKATQLLHQAQEYVSVVHPLNGWFALVLASIAAKEGHKQQCEAYLTDAMNNAYHLPQTPDVADLYFTDFSLTSVHMFTVSCWLTIGNAAKAYDHLGEMNLEDLADNRRASAYCDASRACTMMGEFELAQQLAFRAIDKAFLTQQLYLISLFMMVSQTIQQKAPDKPYAGAITEYAHLTLQQS